MKFLITLILLGQAVIIAFIGSLMIQNQTPAEAQNLPYSQTIQLP